MASPKRRYFKKVCLIMSALNKANANLEMLFIIVLCVHKRKTWDSEKNKKAWLARRIK